MGKPLASREPGRFPSPWYAVREWMRAARRALLSLTLPDTVRRTGQRWVGLGDIEEGTTRWPDISSSRKAILQNFIALPGSSRVTPLSTLVRAGAAMVRHRGLNIHRRLPPGACAGHAGHGRAGARRRLTSTDAWPVRASAGIRAPRSVAMTKLHTSLLPVEYIGERGERRNS